MFTTARFKVNELQASDALALSKLMVKNTKRFERDFPQTLALNLNEQASRTYIQKKQIENTARTEFTWAIRETSTNLVTGLIIVKALNWERGIGEFAYCIDVDFETRGWTTEVVRLLSRHAFEILGLKTLRIIVHKTNFASIRIAKKCGFLWQKTLLKEHTSFDGSVLDMELYERYNDKRQ